MNQFNKIHHCLLTAVTAVVLAMTTLASCTEVDDTLGSNLIPDNQQFKAGYIALPEIGDRNPKKYVETRLFQTDSVLSANISYGYMGSMLNDTVGLRTAGFLSQYASYYRVDSGYFGYRPIFDSIQLTLSINGYGKDTMSVQDFEVYEVIDNDYLLQKPITEGRTKRDSAFYIGFNPEAVPYLNNRSIISQEPLFTFKLGGETGPSTKAVTLNPTEKGREFISRLMLQSGEHKGDYTIYNPDSVDKWTKAFKGIYIKPTTNPQTMTGGSTKGTIYSTDLKSTSLSIYGRNRQKEDPTLIKDTIGMVFYMYDPQRTDANMSINVIDRDYTLATSPAKLNPDDIREPAAGGVDRRPENSRVYVEGMGGVTTEMRFTKEFFMEMEQIIEKENALTGQNFSTMAFNQMLMEVYFPSSDYRWEEIDPMNPGQLIGEMDSAPKRLGMYKNYKTLEPITDYPFTYEESYGITISYGGYVNRSRGCYMMDITSHAQEVWNNYLDQKEQAGINRNASYKDIDWSKIKWNEIKNCSVYIAPEAYDLYTPSFTVLQGSVTQAGESVVNNAPIRFEVVYNLVK